MKTPSDFMTHKTVIPTLAAWSFFFFFFFNSIGVYLIYNLVLLSAVQLGESVTHTYLAFFFLFPYRSLWSIRAESLVLVFIYSVIGPSFYLLCDMS